jgi:DUF1680 family protein
MGEEREESRSRLRLLVEDRRGRSSRSVGIPVASGLILILLLASGHAVDPAEILAAENGDRVAPVMEIATESFPLEHVRLLDGPFKHAMELDRKYLRSLDPDRLLHVFRLNAGVPSSAKPYGGWMAPGHNSRGEFVGHYLSACARMYADTGDEELKGNASRVVAGLAQCQRHFGNGYLHTHPDAFSSRCEAPIPFWYQIHKVLAGLLDVHLHCGNDQALEVAQKLGDWAWKAASRFPDTRIQPMLQIEHGGINEAFANLYARTGDERYLKLSLRFNHRAVLGPAMKGEDTLDGLHANTQIPKFIGAARQYEMTGDTGLKAASVFFWETVVRERSYVIGGNSNGELFSRKASLSEALGPDNCETCNTYNMLKLTHHLFLWDPKTEYADYYERALFNHILASQNPESGMLAYYMPLNGGPKVFGDPENSFWCCYGTGIENHARYGENIYFHRANKSLYVNLFIASELDWKELGLKVLQETRYPETETSRLTLTCEKPVQLTLNVRQPSWATSGVEIAVNSQKTNTVNRPGSYASLSRRWQTGDTIDLRMPMSVRTEGFRDNPRRRAILFGPLVLCAPGAPEKPSPVIVSEIERIPSGIRPTGECLCFEGSTGILRSVASEQRRLVRLIPFYKECRQPYVTYWDVVDEAQWATRRERYQAEVKRQQAMAARVVDRVVIGSEQSEKAHRVQGQKTEWGPGTGATNWRHAVDGGWFAYEMKSPKSQSLELICTYWGGDSGDREFDVLIDGVRIATQTLRNDRPGEYFDQTYPIPVELTAGKEKVTVRFQAHSGKTAGGVFGCQLLKRE